MDKEMANARVDCPDLEVGDLGLRVFRGERIMHGGCNLCTYSEKYRVVNVIQLRNLEFRLCDKCKKKLKKLL